MFKPTKFPCQAWRLTPMLDVLECTVNSECRTDPTWVYTSADMQTTGSLFATKGDAVVGANKKLLEFELRLHRAQARHPRRVKRVAELEFEMHQAKIAQKNTQKI